MASENTVTLIGNITRDPELRYTPSGQPRTAFGLAVNRRWQNRDSGEWEESASFFDVVCWSEMAENVGGSLAKGQRVIVTGRLEQRSWETQEGEKRSKIEVIADEIGPSLRWATAKVDKTERQAERKTGAGTASSNGNGSALASSAARPVQIGSSVSLQAQRLPTGGYMERYNIDA
jgi:single-strand DNA-binding protein